MESQSPKNSIQLVILGQGLVGTLLSFQLLERNIEHIVIDDGHRSSSSMAAAGIINPVTGRRFVKAWNIEKLLEELGLYRRIEKQLKIKVLYRLDVLRDLERTEALNQWDMRRSDQACKPYMDEALTNVVAYETYFENKGTTVSIPQRSGPTKNCFRVDLQLLLSSYRTVLKDNGMLRQTPINENKLVANHKRIIDCTGARAITSAWWSWLPWRGTKGEALRFPWSAASRLAAIKRKAFVCPVGPADEVWVGATNEDRYQDDKPSASGKANLLTQLAGFTSQVEELICSAQHLSAIRPTTKTRRPFLGAHPAIESLFLCNGMGTKGTSLAPWCTRLMVNHLLDATALDPELDIYQFWSDSL